MADNKVLKEIAGIKVITLEETAEMLGVTILTCKRYFISEKLKAQKIGGRWYTTEENIQDFVTGKYGVYKK